MAAAAGGAGSDFDHAAAAKAFDETKSGVKGLVDAGITAVPPLFLHPSATHLPRFPPPPSLSIPTVDLSLPRRLAVEAVAAACRDWGFFQLVNHGIPAGVTGRAIAAIRAFNELPAAERAPFYTRAFAGGVTYSSNIDLYRSSAASWRDTIQMRTSPELPDVSRIPPAGDILDWDRAAAEVGREVLGLMSEGLGLTPARIEELSCLEQRLAVCHYYPPCPEPEKTMGTAVHTDPSVLTFVAQDDVGGLQVRRQDDDGGWYWVDVEPLPGAIVVNVGDLLQMMSNDEYKSVEHRVVINSRAEARVSVVLFFLPSRRGDEDFYGPLPELTSSPEKPPLYRNFTVKDFLTAFGQKSLGLSLRDKFKV